MHFPVKRTKPVAQVKQLVPSAHVVQVESQLLHVLSRTYSLVLHWLTHPLPDLRNLSEHIGQLLAVLSAHVEQAGLQVVQALAARSVKVPSGHYYVQAPLYT